MRAPHACLLLPFIAGCASAPAPAPSPRPRPVPEAEKEAYGVGGLGPIEDGKPIPHELGVNGQEGGDSGVPFPPNQRTHEVVARGAPGEELLIEKVMLDRLSVDRGRKASGMVRFRAPASASLTLEARADGAEEVRPIGRRRADWGITLPCPPDGPARLRLWKLNLVDDTGRPGNTAEVAIQCTGRTPPPPPQLEIELDTAPLAAGARRTGEARITGAKAPFWLMAHAKSSVDGYQWMLAFPRPAATAKFVVACRKGKPAHAVLWHFHLWDADGMTTRDVDRTIQCQPAG